MQKQNRKTFFLAIVFVELHTLCSGVCLNSHTISSRVTWQAFFLKNKSSSAAILFRFYHRPRYTNTATGRIIKPTPSIQFSQPFPPLHPDPRLSFPDSHFKLPSNPFYTKLLIPNPHHHHKILYPHFISAGRFTFYSPSPSTFYSASTWIFNPPLVFSLEQKLI